MTINVTNVCNYVITLIVSRYDSFVPVTNENIFRKYYTTTRSDMYLSEKSRIRFPKGNLI